MNIPKPKELREKFLTEQNGVVQSAIREVSDFLRKEYRPNKPMYPPMPKDTEAAKAVAEQFRLQGWTVKHSFDQRDGDNWSFSDVPDAEGYYSK